MFDISEKPQIRVSVRNFVEFLLRSGDIDNRIKSSASDVETMQEGARIHRLIQRRMGLEYHAEVSLSHIESFESFDLLVEGRADGIIEGDIITIDEIKTTHKELIHLTKANPVHFAQAKCYAYFVLKELHNKVSVEDFFSDTELVTVTKDEIAVLTPESFNEINVRLTYCNADSLECKYFHESYTFEQLEKFYLDLANEYKKWAEFELTWKDIRNDSIKEVTFPYGFRTGQKELIGQVYKTVISNERLFVEAPTGTGKTIATIYPSIKAMGEDRASKIFYLTAKTITRTAACDCIDLLREKALRLKSVVITAKEKICVCEKNCECNPDVCEHAKGHFDRINDAIYDLIISADSFTRETITEYAIKHKVCPFEFGLDVSLFCDAIICDYNYVFDPNVYLRRFFQDTAKRDYIFLVDESHNLVDRAMEMYSATIEKEEFLDVKRKVKPFDRKLERALETVNKRLLEMKHDLADCDVLEGITSLAIALIKCQGQLERFLDEDEHCPDREDVLDLYFKVRHFMNMYENMTDDDYIIYDTLTPENHFMVKLLCTNPSRNIKECIDKGISTVFFSATLLPIQYYKDMLTGEDDSAVYANSVFDENKRGIFISKDVSSRYTRRNETEYINIAKYIDMAIRSKDGNYMVFFPSYAFMNSVQKAYEEYYLDEDIYLIAQNPHMTEADRENFLSCFSDNITDVKFKSLVGFCVIGGIFSEGIDLKGENLIGALIVGTGLPMVTKERELLKNKYTDEGFNGFDYAYKYPGMNKVLQAAGRVIRTEEDRGIICLLDERFLERNYLRLFPREWSNYSQTSLENGKIKFGDFWSSLE